MTDAELAETYRLRMEEFASETDRLRKEMDGLYRTQASMQADCEAQEAEIESLRQTMAEMQDDLDAAYRLLGLAPYPLTA